MNNYTKSELYINENSYQYDNKDLVSSEKENLNLLVEKLGKIAIIYKIVDGFLSIGSSDKKRLKKKLNKEISNLRDSEIDKETEYIDKLFFDKAKENYYMKCFLLSTYYTVDYRKISDKEINEIINKEYLDKRYQERIKKNKQDVYDDINALINQFLDGKIDINTIYSEVEKKYSLNAYMSKRLVESEITRIQSDINDKFAEENGIEWQMYMATLDEHTCRKCAKDDGEVFKVDDPDKPKLPRHPFDRCCFVNLPEKNYKPKSRMDNKSKKIIDYKSYQEWYKEQNID